VTDESERPPDSEPPPASEPSPASEPPPASEPSPARAPGAPEGIGEGAGTVLAFRSRSRRDAAGRSSSDSAASDTAASHSAASHSAASHSAASHTAASHTAGWEYPTRSGYDVDNESVLADATLTAGTDLTAGIDLTAGTDLTVSGVLLADTDADFRDADRDDGGVDARPVDWAWVEEWRAGHEPVPWASGLGLAAFSALVVGVAVWVLSAGLADSPVLAIGVNLLVAGGLAPAMWLSRGLPVLRWIALGSAVGVLAGWVCALTMLPLPTP